MESSRRWPISASMRASTSSPLARAPRARAVAISFRVRLNANQYTSEITLGPAFRRVKCKYGIEVNGRAARELVLSFDEVFLVPEIPGMEGGSPVIRN